AGLRGVRSVQDLRLTWSRHWRGLPLRRRHRGGRGRDQELAEPGEHVVPGGKGLFLVAALAGVVVEGVLRARVDVDLERDVRLLERRHQVVPAFVGEIVRVVGVDAEDRSTDVGYGLQRRWRAIPRHRRLELRDLGRDSPGNAAAEAE